MCLTSLGKQMTDAEPRYFYHSFARRQSEHQSIPFEKELLILQSMIDIGLLLTPEKISYQERLADGSFS